MSQIIDPKILKGTRDFLPLDMVKRKFVMEKIISIFERFGYDGIDTPAIEYAETILGKYGEEGDQLTYTFEDRGERQIALRYDLTVPTARFVAMHAHELPLPFKRYQTGAVWRADKPQKGRYRQFTQCDIDIVGTESLVADAEVAKVITTVFGELGFKEYTIRINTRRLTNAVLKKLGVKEDQFVPIIRIVDKLDKIGEDKVRAELGKISVPVEAIDGLFEIMNLEGGNRDKLSKIDLPECNEISEFLDHCDYFGVPENAIKVDFSLARGLDYYTGIIFEVVVTEPDVGSLCGGGRYDDLCSLFSKQQFPGVGVAFGFERIVLVMDELGMFQDIHLNSQALVAVFDEASQGDAIELLGQVQAAGINAEVYVQADKLAKQFKYADRKQIPYVLIQGPDEKAAGQVMLKDMHSGDQNAMSLEDAVKAMRPS